MKYGQRMIKQTMKMIMIALAVTLLHVSVSAQFIRTIEGVKKKASVVSVEEGTAKLSDGSTLSWMKISDVNTARKMSQKNLNARVYMANGSILQGKAMGFSDATLTIKGEYYEFSVPYLQSYGFLNLPAEGGVDSDGFKAPAAPYLAGFESERLSEDRLLVVGRDGDLLTINGVMVGMDDEAVTFVFRDEQRKLKRNRVYGALFSRAARSSEWRQGLTKALFMDGSFLWGKLISWKDGQITMKVDEQTYQFSDQGVVSLRVISDQLMYLSDMKPVEVQSKRMFSVPPGHPTWFVNRAANIDKEPNPIRLGGKTYSSGLCVLSWTSLSFDLNSKFDVFKAMVGIDDEVTRRGAVQVKVLLDGTEVINKAYKVDEDPESWTIPVKGKDRLTIIVEWGEDGDMGDHFSMGNARLISVD